MLCYPRERKSIALVSTNIRIRGGFSLVELLVSITILAFLLVLLASVGDQIMKTWSRVSASTQFYQDARAALDLIARRVSQATLNPYWAYDDPAKPTRYVRRSDLRFVIQPASSLLGSGFGPGSAMFFQAPLGRSNSAANRQMVELLNTCGFYIERRAGEVAPFPSSAPAGPVKYRLMEVQAPAEAMEVFAAGPATDFAWIQSAINSGHVRQLAENVIFFHVRPLLSADGDNREDVSTNMMYNSAENADATPQPPSANQLPPLLEITLLVLDEASADRFPSSGISFDGKFQSAANFESDLKDLTDELADKGMSHRVLQTRVPLPNSKWSG